MARNQTLESVVRSDIEELGDLSEFEPSLAASAILIAKLIDKAAVEDPRTVAALNRELRITLATLIGARVGDGDDDDAELATPA